MPAAREPGDPEERVRVLLANEPRSYRESIAAVVRQLRPGLEVKVAEPEDLEELVDRFRPHVAIFSRAADGVRERVPVWVELYPEHDARSIVYVEGERTEYAEIQLQDLLSIVDRAAHSN